jgi:hypothetical protein
MVAAVAGFYAKQALALYHAVQARRGAYGQTQRAGAFW